MPTPLRILNGYGMVSVAFLLVMWAFDFVQIISYPFAMGSAWLGLDGAVQMVVLKAGQVNAFSLWAGIISTNVVITSLFFWTLYTLSDGSQMKHRLNRSAHYNYKAHKTSRWRIMILRTYAQVVFNGESARA